MRTALIGLGMVADTHLAAIKDAKDVTLAGVMGRSTQKASAFAQKAQAMLGDPVSVFGSAAEIIAKANIDFVIIATPPDARVDLVSAFAEAKIPILMEKPIERTAQASEQLVDLCASAEVPLAICLQHRARGASVALKKAVDNGQLGKIVSAEIRVPWWRDQAYYDAPGRGTYARDGGGVMINQAIHTLDLALWCLGPFSTVQSLMTTTSQHKMEAEDWAGALFTTNNGAVGSVVATTTAYPGHPESVSLQGTLASAHLESGVLTLSHMDGRTQTIGASAATGAGADPMAFTHAWHQTILENFVDHLKNGTPLIATGASVIAAQHVIGAMERSNSSGQREPVRQ